MPHPHARTEILLDQNTLSKIAKKHILIAGIGGVGGYVVENIVRAGIENITILDGDNVAPSNINRQIVALHSTVGRPKTEVMKQRILDINPNINLTVIQQFLTTKDASHLFNSHHFDFVADCIDTIACKAQLVFEAQQKNIAIISAMGAGNRIDASQVHITQLSKTKGCPLAREVRRRLRQLGASLDYPVVYSNETMRPVIGKPREEGQAFIEKTTNGTISYMPAIIGVLLAGEIIKQLIHTAESEVKK